MIDVFAKIVNGFYFCMTPHHRYLAGPKYASGLLYAEYVKKERLLNTPTSGSVTLFVCLSVNPFISLGHESLKKLINCLKKRFFEF